MLCRKCGKQNEDYLEFCKYCAAELTGDPDDLGNDFAVEDADSDGTAPAWGFVRSPKWSKPKLRADDLDEEEVRTFARRRFEAPTRKEQEATHDDVKLSEAYTESTDDYDDDDGDDDVKIAIPHMTRSKTSDTRPMFKANVIQEDEASDEKPEKIKFADPIEDDYFYEGVDPEDDDDYSDYNKVRSFSKKWIVIAAVAAALVIAIVAGWIVVGSTYGSFANFVDYSFNGNPLMRPVDIAKSTDTNGESIVIFTVYAKKGSTVRFTINGQIQDKVIESGNSFAGYLKESNFLPTTPVEGEGPYVTVTPEISIITPDGKETKITSFVTTDDSIIDILFPESSAAERRRGVEIAGIPVKVPELTLTITAPTDGAEVMSKLVNVTGTVSTNTATVYIEGQQVDVDDTGAFNGIVELAAKGESEIVVEAHKDGYVIARQEITVNYNVNDMSVVFDEGTSLRTKTDTITLTGKLEPGAVIKMSCDKQGISFAGPVTAGADGRFSITATISEVGFYDVTMAITSGSDTSTATVHLERAPEDYRDYYASAFALDYTRLVNDPNHDAHYAITGRVVEIIQAEPYIIAKFVTSDGKEMYFQYHNSYSGAAEIAVSNTQQYKLAAIPNGLYEGTQIPYLYVWFVLKPAS